MNIIKEIDKISGRKIPSHNIMDAIAYYFTRNEKAVISENIDMRFGNNIIKAIDAYSNKGNESGTIVEAIDNHTGKGPSTNIMDAISKLDSSEPEPEPTNKIVDTNTTIYAGYDNKVLIPLLNEYSIGNTLKLTFTDSRYPVFESTVKIDELTLENMEFVVLEDLSIYIANVNFGANTADAYIENPTGEGSLGDITGHLLIEKIPAPKLIWESSSFSADGVIKPCIRVDSSVKKIRYRSNEYNIGDLEKVNKSFDLPGITYSYVLPNEKYKIYLPVFNSLLRVDDYRVLDIDTDEDITNTISIEDLEGPIEYGYIEQ